MSTNVSRALTGALMTGATVMGIDAEVSSVDAAPIIASVEQPFLVSVVDVNPAANTCCFDVRQEVLFDEFDGTLGTLISVSLQIASTQTLQLGGLEALSSSVLLNGQTLGSTNVLGDFGFNLDPTNGGLISLLDFENGRFPISFVSDVNFNDTDTRGEYIWEGLATLSYTFDDSQVSVSAPPIAFLMASATIAILGVAGYRRS